MVETIDPVVHGNRRSRYYLAAGLHALGATVAAGLVGLAAGSVGALAGAPWGATGLIVIAAIAAIYALREMAALPIPIPDRHRQVPLWWRTFYSPPMASLLYGFGLGVGYLTFLSFGTYVAVTMAAVVTGDPLVGAALCAPFGLARATSVILAHKATRAPETKAIDRVDDLAATRWPKLANAVALVAVALAAGAAAL